MPTSGATVASTTPHSAVAAPTDRSTWPAISSIVPGAAKIPVTAMAVRMLMMLFVARKNSLATEK